MTPEFVIQGRLIGGHYPAAVIAEIGVNHEGKTGIAMVEAASSRSGDRREVRL